MMQLYAKINSEKIPPLAKQDVQVNSSHPIIKKMNILRQTDTETAKLFANQIFDTALIQAGLYDFEASHAARFNKLVDMALPDHLLAKANAEIKETADAKVEDNVDKPEEK